MLKKVSKIFYWLLLALLVLVAGATAFTILEAPGGYRLFVVQSGSMEPVIKTASMVLVVPQSEYRQGEVITFLANPSANLKHPGSTITHRIVAVKDDEGRKIYQTKGDANNAADKDTVSQKQILGKTLFSVPYIGYVIAFTKTQLGLITLIVIPGTIIIYSEVMKIKQEILKMLVQRKVEDDKKLRKTRHAK